MLSRKSKKEVQAPLPDRPPAPTLAEIIKDISASESDDIIFRLRETREEAEPANESPLTVHNLMSESFYSEDSKSTFADSSKSVSADSAEDLSESIDDMYDKSLKFIKLNSELQKAPDALQQQCHHLQELSSELKISIQKLQEKASIVKASSN
ncbi:hypothetical protein CAPTEDRAFT_228143 [Capitella teleta]|uniref:Uncharacterized protein n=1 Tax=Capitella teleta TaxID=283909 RepID=R7UG41_CAPTE|nr:hypothetical protein CAPTEDRAFT_228143 [Capitella teleta]|eukprot:ELU05170.1 hypothetical protein CAPTEDRAFT_228143 [Capitella teleta]